MMYINFVLKNKIKQRIQKEDDDVLSFKTVFHVAI